MKKFICLLSIMYLAFYVMACGAKPVDAEEYNLIIVTNSSESEAEITKVLKSIDEDIVVDSFVEDSPKRYLVTISTYEESTKLLSALNELDFVVNAQENFEISID